MTRKAAEEIARALGPASARLGAERRWQALTARRLRHGAFEARTAAMSEHVVIGYLNRCGVGVERELGRVGQRGVARAGTLSLIPAGAEAVTRVRGPVEVVHLFVAPERLAGLAREIGADPPDLAGRVAFPDPAGAQLLGLLARELEGPGVGGELFAEHLGELVCLHLLREHSRPGGPARPRPERGGMGPARLRRVLDHVAANLAGPVSLADLAGLAGLSRSHFARAFRRETGLAPCRYVAQARIERARHLLETTGLPVTEVGARCGYERPDHFATAFRRAVGAAPRSYRRARRD